VRSSKNPASGAVVGVGQGEQKEARPLIIAE
jgi:hypothetical protein